MTPTDAEVEAVARAIQTLLPQWLAEDGTINDDDLARAAIAALDQVRPNPTA